MARRGLAEEVRDVELAQYQRVVRMVLLHPLIGQGHPSAEALSQVRRWAPQLRQDLESLGYALLLGSGSARLQRPLDVIDADAPLTSRSGRPFGRRRYALLCLSLAAVEVAQHQITLTDMATLVRRRAEEIPGLGFDPDQHSHRRAFCDAVAVLEDRQILTLTDGSARAWEQRSGDGEALYDVDREVARLLFRPPRPLHQLGSLRQLLRQERSDVGREMQRGWIRQRLMRWLLERPVLYFSDLTEAERAYVQREAAPMSAELTRLTGCPVERRREGLALVDPGVGFSDLRFPTVSSAGQSALLLIDRIAARMGEAPSLEEIAWPTLRERGLGLSDQLDACIPDELRGGDEVEIPGVELPPPAPAPFLPERWLLGAAAEIQAQYGDVLAAGLATDPAQLVAEVVTMLAAHGLLLPVPGGALVLPALARYREAEVARAPETLSLFSQPTAGG